ncbi:MAG TPA: ABC transporter substrate-binding protein [Aestuariivirga sp.]|nr:ABC transporter substrate-binding protein [Aestuariivirga sp.]
MVDHAAGPVGRRQFIGLLLGSVFGAGAALAANPAEAYVSRIAEEVMALANSGARGNALRNRFAALLNRYISLRAIANYALGRYQSKLPAGKRNEFYQLVSNYAAGLFVFYVNDFKGSKLDITSTTKQGNFTIIQSTIKGGGEKIRWRLSGGGGGYRVSDVNIKGVWLTIAMRDRFNKVLKRSDGNFDALFAELREANSW